MKPVRVVAVSNPNCMPYAHHAENEKAKSGEVPDTGRRWKVTVDERKERRSGG